MACCRRYAGTGCHCRTRLRLVNVTANLVKRQGHVLPDYCSFDLSPITMTGKLRSACSRSASARRVALVTDEWIPSQRPLFNETTINSLCFQVFPVVCWKISVKWVSYAKGPRDMPTAPKFAEPYSLLACIASRVFASFVDAIIFIYCAKQIRSGYACFANHAP